MQGADATAFTLETKEVYLWQNQHTLPHKSFSGNLRKFGQNIFLTIKKLPAPPSMARNIFLYTIQA